MSVSLDFIEQLLSAELLFVVVFLISIVLIGLCYLLGMVVERGWALMKQKALGHLTDLRGALPARSLRPNAVVWKKATS